MRPITDRRGALAALPVVAALVVAALGAAGPAVAAGEPPTMTARVLLQGHARLGSWIAIQVHLHNDGPSVSGELRLQGGSQGGTRYAAPVQLDSPSDKDWILYAQPPSFGQQLEVVLASGDDVIARKKVAVTVHDPSQLVVGVVAEEPQPLLGTLSLPAVQNQQAAVVVPLGLEDLPTRLEAWSALDRLVWQDVDASSLTSEQLTALRGWIALGGRLIVVGGTGGIGTLGGFPDDLLPYRPASTVDVPPAALRGLLGTLPAAAADVPAMAGELTRGRALATSGDRVIAAQATYGAGSVTIVGIDPTAGWIGESTAGASLWPALIPPRSDGDRRGERRHPDRRRRQQPAVARPAAARRAAAAAVRLHRPDRPDQLPRPAPARPSRVGVGHDADPHRRVRRWARTPSATPSGAAA